MIFMKRRLTILLLFTSCAHNGVHAPTAVEQAVAAATLKPTDPLETKIQKALHLLNQERYLEPKVAGPKLAPPFDVPYHLDSLRTPEQILAQKVGGYCASAALAFSAMLRQAGVPSEDLRVVGGVYGRDERIICPLKGELRVEHPRSGASGHVFVALKFPGGGWRLINTIDGTNYESVPWFPPQETDSRLRSGPLPIPFAAYGRFPAELRALPMIVFQQWRLEDVPLHTFEQRLNLVASGTVEGKRCRY
jgi:hypothetical protein